MEKYIYHSKDVKNRVTVVGEFDNNELRLAVARCSSNDNFCRRIGRELATNRLNNGEMYVTIRTPKMDRKRFNKFADFFAKELQSNSTVVQLTTV